MISRRHLHGLQRAAFAVVVAASWPVLAADSVEVQELRAALKVAQEDAAAQRSRADEAETKRQALVQSLSEAVRVSEEQTAAALETEMKLQALGVDLVTRDENSLEQRLLKAVRDLDIAHQQGERQTSAIRRLSETLLKVLEASPELSAKARSEADQALAAANAALKGEGNPVAVTDADLSASRVVSIDGEIGLVVFDAGRRSGLRVGTPVAILRDERVLYSALVVDVRDSIAGAVLQDRMAEGGDVEIGDGIRLLPEQNTL